MHCGNFMSGGTIEILGNADAWLGREMRGGTILCRGNAGHYCATGYRGEKKGMQGGRVEVFGNTGISVPNISQVAKCISMAAPVIFPAWRCGVVS